MTAPASTSSPSAPVTARLLGLIWPFLLATGVLLLLALASVRLIAAGRAYTEGESLWSKGQKDAAQLLYRYHRDCDPRLYERFRESIALPLGDREARLAMLQTPPDRARAAQGLLQGGNHPDEIAGMVFVFVHLHDVWPLREAVAVWTEADALLVRMLDIAESLDRSIRSDCQARESREPLLERLDAVNDELTPLQRRFSDVLGETNRRISAIALAVMLLTGSGLAAGGVWLSRRAMRAHVRTEAALATSEQRLRLALEGSRQGLWDMELDTGRVYVSPELDALMQAPQGIADARSLAELVHPDDRERVREVIGAQRRASGRFDLEARLQTGGGGARWFRIAGQLIDDGRGRATRIVGHALDVDEHRRLTEALAQELAHRREALGTLHTALAALVGAQQADDDALPRDEMEAVAARVGVLARAQQAARMQLESILALSPDGFVSFDTDDRVLHASPPVAALTGLAARTLIGMPAGTLHAQLQARAAPGSAPLPPGFATTDGRPALLRLAGEPARVLAFEVRSGDAGPIRRILCVRDVTREHAMDRLKREFITVAAHELRTPMASIFGFVDLLMQRQIDPVRTRELYAIVHRNARLMMGIVDDLLDLSRLEAHGAAGLKRERLDLHALVAEGLASFNPPEGRAAPVLAPAAGAAPVQADRERLVRVLLNLVGNAYKYSPQGGAVDVAVQERPGEVGIAVRDRGIGMAPEVVARVGERFFRADPSGQVSGTGLGLSIVREILHLHGGTLAVRSEPGVGTTVTAWLPRQAEG